MAIKETQNKITQKEIEEYRGKVLSWYDKHGRELPWRYKNGEKANPYYVWLSEIMCQQTTVQAVKSYYTKFLETWPTVHDLANADNDDVMAAWAGLGYYARARNLHKCAKIISNDMAGKFPNTANQLKELPGIGDYTSAAVAAIAFDESTTVMDGNIERIMARFFKIEDPLPKSKSIFKTHTSRFFDEFDQRTGDFAQALMDIGSAICTPKNPKCMICPLNEGCVAKNEGVQESLPVKIKKKNRPHKYGDVYWITNDKGEVLFHKRPEKGLLAGMTALPTSSWELKGKNVENPECLANLKYEDTKTSLNHVFTHFDLTLSLKKLSISSHLNVTNEYFWANIEGMENKLPTVFRKPFVQFMLL
jgi:A/G-specific adenine glycosylase